LTALWQAQQNGFQEDAEISERLGHSKAVYRRQLQRTKLRSKLSSYNAASISAAGGLSDDYINKVLNVDPSEFGILPDEHPQGSVEPSEFSYCRYHIKPISEDKFRGILRARKFRFTLKKYVHECPLQNSN
jgi:hypothetical protein